jgi:hypothetical protein
MKNVRTVSGVSNDDEPVLKLYQRKNVAAVKS